MPTHNFNHFYFPFLDLVKSTCFYSSRLLMVARKCWDRQRQVSLSTPSLLPLQSPEAADTHTATEGHQPTAEVLNSSSHDSPVATSAVATTTATTVGEDGSRELTNHRPEGGGGAVKAEEGGGEEEGGTGRKPNDVRSGELQDGEVGSEELSDNFRCVHVIRNSIRPQDKYLKPCV